MAAQLFRGVVMVGPGADGFDDGVSRGKPCVFRERTVDCRALGHIDIPQVQALTRRMAVRLIPES
jgi:hypothetical protein